MNEEPIQSVPEPVDVVTGATPYDPAYVTEKTQEKRSGQASVNE